MVCLTPVATVVLPFVLCENNPKTLTQSVVPYVFSPLAIN